MVNTSKLPGFTFHFFPFSDDAAVYTINCHITCAPTRSQHISIWTCLFNILVLIAYLTLTWLYDSLWWMCRAGSHGLNFNPSSRDEICNFPVDFLTIKCISNVTMAVARHPNFVWQHCLCSVWTKKWGASVYMNVNIMTDSHTQAPLHHKLFKTTKIMLRNYCYYYCYN